MKLLLDLRSIYNLESGDGQFSSQIINQLMTIDKTNEYILLVRPKNKDFFKSNNPDFRLNVIDLYPYTLKERFVLPKIVRDVNPDIYHTFTFSYPKGIDCKTIITIYDITHLMYPHFFSFLLKLYYTSVVNKCVKTADEILTISEHSKSDIVNKFRISFEKVKVVHCGVNPLYREIDKEKAYKYINDKFSISERFILYVGQIKKHKNIEVIIYSLKKVLQSGVNINLVVCGRGSRKAEWLLKLIKKLNIKDKVKLVDSPTDADLLNFYNAAILFVFPSLYEGFGLPPLEAMACGTPVISSNAGALFEILGNAAKLVNPYDIEEISNAINEVLSNIELADFLSKKGLERSKLFSWEKSAKELLDLYKDIIKS